MGGKDAYMYRGWGVKEGRERGRERDERERERESQSQSLRCAYMTGVG